MKNQLAVFAGMTLLALALVTACGNSSSHSGESDVSILNVETAESATSQDMNAEAVTSQEMQVEAATGVKSETSAETKESVQSKTNTAVTVSEAVLYDENGLKATVTGLDMNDSFMGPALQILLENTSGQSLTVQARNVSVNGYMMDALISEEIQNGKKANGTMTFSSDDLKECGIDTIADIEFSLHIYNSESWGDYADSPQLSVKTSAYGTYVQTYDDSGQTMYDDGSIRVIAKELTDDSIFGPSIKVFIENNSGSDITIQVRDASVNDFMVSPTFSSQVMPGKKAIDMITFNSWDLEENNITKFEKVELSFHIFNTDTWDTIIDTEPVVISFN